MSQITPTEENIDTLYYLDDAMENNEEALHHKVQVVSKGKFETVSAYFERASYWLGEKLYKAIPLPFFVPFHGKLGQAEIRVVELIKRIVVD